MIGVSNDEIGLNLINLFPLLSVSSIILSVALYLPPNDDELYLYNILCNCKIIFGVINISS